MHDMHTREDTCTTTNGLARRSHGVEHLDVGGMALSALCTLDSVLQRLQEHYDAKSLSQASVLDRDVLDTLGRT